MDATTFPIPDEQIVFYFFRPFGENVMAKVLANIEKSYADRTRKMYVVYYAPHCRYLIEDMSFLRSVDIQLPRFAFSAPYRRGLAIYESIPV